MCVKCEENLTLYQQPLTLFELVLSQYQSEFRHFCRRLRLHYLMQPYFAKAVAICGCISSLGRVG
jgi:hypothetical protein